MVGEMTKNKRNGIIGAVVFAAILLLLFVFVFYNMFSPSRSMVASPETADMAAQLASAEKSAATSTVPNTPKLIKTATVRLDVGEGEFDKKFSAAREVAKKFGGYATDSSTNRDDGGAKSGSVTLRIPTDRFDKVIDEIKKLGTVTSVDVKAQDVSEEYVDLESRLKNLSAQEKKLLEIMEKAGTVDETLKVQAQLTTVQGDIEVIVGRMDFLDNRVDYSTVIAEIYEPGSVVPESSQWGFVDALTTALKAFLWTINAIIVVFGALLPLAIIIAVIVVLRRWMEKRPKKTA